MKRENLEYRDWIKTLPCANGDQRGITECHHLKGDFNMSGAGMLAPDFFCMPYCVECHRDHHAARPGWKETQREALIRTLIRAYQEGKIGFI